MNKVVHTQHKTSDAILVDPPPQHTRRGIFWMCRCVVWWKETAAYIFRIFWSNLKKGAADNVFWNVTPCCLVAIDVCGGTSLALRQDPSPS